MGWKFKFLYSFVHHFLGIRKKGSKGKCPHRKYQRHLPCWSTSNYYLARGKEMPTIIDKFWMNRSLNFYLQFHLQRSRGFPRQTVLKGGHQPCQKCWVLPEEERKSAIRCCSRKAKPPNWQEKMFRKKLWGFLKWCLLGCQDLIHGCLKHMLSHGQFHISTQQRIKTNLIMVFSNYFLK